ncbi:CARDB domain-containing protein [Haloarchaeobius baliensis]|uniref:CARDB domain-containing protein n=1 Tax=Haloarchaeobius baliensis TaxID=1670458 RepID=UPI003F882830
MTDQRRRAYLKHLSAFGLSAALAGCSSRDRSSGSERTTPETTPEQTTRGPSRETTAGGQPSFTTSVSHPGEASVGDTVTVTVDVENTGDGAGAVSLALGIGRDEVDTASVTLDGGASTSVQLQGTLDESPADRTTALTLNGEVVGELTVVPATDVEGDPVGDRSLPRRVGASYTGPKYRVDESLDTVNDGASSLESLGSRVFKGWMDDPDLQYPFVDWPSFDSIVEVFQHPRYRELFGRDFDTYVFTGNAYTQARATGGGGYFYHEFSEEYAEMETEAFYDITRHLLETYDGTGLEFVLQNWEGDWIVVGGAGREGPPDPDVLDRAKRWFNARQRGIARARAEVESDVAVLGACEINRVRQAMTDGEGWIVNTILGDLDVDLVSYSAWGLCGHLGSYPRLNEEARRSVRETLDYVQSHAPEPTDYVRRVLGDDAKTVYVGEYGGAIQRSGVDPVMRAVRGVTEEALDWGAPYTLFWTTYDNEVHIDGERVVVDPDIEERLRAAFDDGPDIEDVLGFYLVRPDGSRAPAWFYLAEVLGTNAADFVRLDLEFERTVPENELNDDIPPESARQLAFACFEVGVEAVDGGTTLDIGTIGDEAALASGVYDPEETDDETFRWFGRSAGRTTVYLHREEHGLSGALQRLRFVGSGADDGLSAAVRLDGTAVGSVSLSRGRERYDVDLRTEERSGRPGS